jgi:hypothetical protein
MSARSGGKAEAQFDWFALWIIVLGAGALVTALNILWSLS